MSYNPNQPRQAGRFAETATPAEQRASAPPPAAPVTVTCEHDKPAGKTLCPGCWYSGAVLAANMADTITELNTATGLDWKPEHTGGGCFWLTAQRNGVAVAIVTADGPFAGDDTIDAVTESGGWMIGAYDLEGDPLHDGEADDIAGIIDYCNQVIPDGDVTDWLEEGFTPVDAARLLHADIDLPLAMDYMEDGIHDASEMIAKHTELYLPPHQI